MITYSVIFQHLGIWSSLKLSCACKFVYLLPPLEGIQFLQRVFIGYGQISNLYIAPYQFSKYAFISYLNKFSLKNKGRHKQGD